MLTFKTIARVLFVAVAVVMVAASVHGSEPKSKSIVKSQPTVKGTSPAPMQPKVAPGAMNKAGHGQTVSLRDCATGQATGIRVKSGNSGTRFGAKTRAQYNPKELGID